MSPRHTPHVTGTPRYRTPRRAVPHSPRARLFTLSAGVILVISSSVYLLPASSHGAGAARPPSHDSTFGIATFNILGSQHTAGPGGHGPGVVRARVTASMILHRHLDLVGMQEVQADQLGVLTRLLPTHQIWPGSTLGRGSLRLQIAFKRSRFELVEHGTISTPFDRQERPIPWVLLRERVSDRLFYVVTIHNSPRRLEEERDTATRRQVALLRQLRASGHGVFVMGDANEKEEFFCEVVGRTDLEAANGGTAASLADCEPPEGYLPIDWIMGKGAFTFSDYAIDDDAQVEKASDHHLVRATVNVRAKR